MSMRIALDDLTDALGDRPFGYLLTIGDDGRPRAIALAATPQSDPVALLFVLGSSGTLESAAQRPQVSVVFPPTAGDPYSIIVDGEAVVDRDAGTVTVRVAGAVRHRPAPDC